MTGTPGLSRRPPDGRAAPGTGMRRSFAVSAARRVRWCRDRCRRSRHGPFPRLCSLPPASRCLRAGGDPLPPSGGAMGAPGSSLDGLWRIGPRSTRLVGRGCLHRHPELRDEGGALGADRGLVERSHCSRSPDVAPDRTWCSNGSTDRPETASAPPTTANSAEAAGAARRYRADPDSPHGNDAEGTFRAVRLTDRGRPPPPCCSAATR